MQNVLKDFSSYYFVLKSTKEIENSSGHSDYPTKKIICSIDYKTFKRILTIFFLKKEQTKLKTVQLFTKRNELSVQRIAKLLEGF